tara:strand:+ start:3178 stop:3432 length:255 start_codon:yes stop_codon:yes gene_type:complete
MATEEKEENKVDSTTTFRDALTDKLKSINTDSANRYNEKAKKKAEADKLSRERRRAKQEDRKSRGSSITGLGGLQGFTKKRTQK